MTSSHKQADRPNGGGVLVTGANGVVGVPLVQALESQGINYLCVSRHASTNAREQLQWDLHHELSGGAYQQLVGYDTLIHCAPIWLLPRHLSGLRKAGIRRLVVFSSTSVLSKQQSDNAVEQRLVGDLASAEKAVREFCSDQSSGADMHYTILRPSMIYGGARDQNISHIAHFIQKRGFILLVGKAQGLRQPVHADDLVTAALSILRKPTTYDKAYNLAGGEVLSYNDMVTRIFAGLGKRPRILRLPLALFRVALAVAAKLTRFSYTPEMADRMNQDLAYSNQAATDDFGYQPSAFLLKPEQDLPQ